MALAGRKGLVHILGFNLATAFRPAASADLEAAIIASSMPCWALFAGLVAVGQRITRRQWVGALLRAAGLLVLLGPSALAGWQARGWLAPELMLGAALSWR